MLINWSAGLPLGWSRAWMRWWRARPLPGPARANTRIVPAARHPEDRSPQRLARPLSRSYVTARSDGMKKSSYSGEQAAVPLPLSPPDSLPLCLYWEMKMVKRPQKYNLHEPFSLQVAL